MVNNDARSCIVGDLKREEPILIFSHSAGLLPFLDSEKMLDW